MALTRPPTNTKADTIAGKGWLNDVYRELGSGILVPNGGNFLAPVLSSRRNLLVNGDFSVNQRAASFYKANDALIWTVDRWMLRGDVNPGNVWINLPTMNSVSNPLLGFSSFITFDYQSGSTTSSLTTFAQGIESFKILPLAGLPVTLSFWLYGEPAYNAVYWTPQTFNNSTGVIQAIVESGTGTNEATIGTYTGSSIVASLGVTPTAEFFTHYKISGVIPKTAAELRVTFKAQRSTTAYVTGGGWGLAGVQLEVGTSSTAYDKISFDQSLIECQRFYEKSFNYAVAPSSTTSDSRGMTTYIVQIASIGSIAAGFQVSVPFKVRKVASPTVTGYNYNNLLFSQYWWNFNKGAYSNVVIVSNASEYGCSLRNKQLGTDAVKNIIGIHWTASADF